MNNIFPLIPIGQWVIIPNILSASCLMNDIFNFVFYITANYINQIVYPEEYEEYTYMWKDYTREEKSDLIMRYVDNVELTLCGKNKVKIGEVFFRESMCKPCNDLYDAGFLAKKIMQYSVMLV